MKAAILYASLEKLTDLHRILQPTALTGDARRIVPVDGPSVYVRMDIVNADTLSDALDLADPMVGEVVLNTISLK